MLISVVAILAEAAMCATAEDEGYMSRAELRRLVSAANTPADYQRLATFFHFQEDAYRAKAQAQIDDYATCVRNFLMAPKFPTRADQDFRLFEYYSAKADAQAEAAARYEDMLLAMGVKPLRHTCVVSLKDRQGSAHTPGTNPALLPTVRSATEFSKQK
jgi:hypothetical protein